MWNILLFFEEACLIQLFHTRNSNVVGSSLDRKPSREPRGQYVWRHVRQFFWILTSKFGVSRQNWPSKDKTQNLSLQCKIKIIDQLENMKRCKIKEEWSFYVNPFKSFVCGKFLVIHARLHYRNRWGSPVIVAGSGVVATDIHIQHIR